MEQDEFIKFHAYYNFAPSFCNPASAHEKGGVEGLVGYVRRKLPGTIPVAESFEDLDDKLLAECLAYGDHRIKGWEGTVNKTCRGAEPSLVFAGHAVHRHPDHEDGKVDAYSTVIVDKNRYSVPTRSPSRSISRWPGGPDNGRKLVTHPRLFGNNKWQPNRTTTAGRLVPLAGEIVEMFKAMRKGFPLPQVRVFAYAGRSVGSIKRAFETAVKKAGIEDLHLSWHEAHGYKQLAVAGA